MTRNAAFVAHFLLAAAFALAAAPGGAEPRAPARAEPERMLPTLFSDEDYPAAAIRNHEEGPVGFSLSVGADGRPTGCSVTSSSGSSILDSTTCRLLMERARFRPARDAEGRPTVDRFNGRIVWRMGEALPSPLQTALMLWTSCVLGEAAKLIPGDLPPAEIAGRAFPPCAALEGLVAGKTGGPVRRANLETIIESSVVQARAALKEPAESAEAP